ncbi:transcriptional regulator [Sphingobium yanoikuyae]|uniref:Helix-turn-helix domain-containing protein n=1 Tax=Sphingobium yanoikuyae TaxID=13690 RepID=A0A291N6M2_SPHYA|nr:YdaS family helix-turn-helix protein [Sphingobium yanoikuyae]ATI82891.1 hypothetical protein A6768_24745 [Sphingobium yanoikuyae]
MANALTPFEALQLALERAKSQTRFAMICGVGQPAVSKWLQSGKRLPAGHVLAVEAATKVSRHLLRPDLYPPPQNAKAYEPGEECGPILSGIEKGVACDQQPKMQRKDVA